MAMSIEERMDTLHDALKELAYAGRRTEMSLDRLSVEMRELKDEMRDFKDEMLTYKEENKREFRRMNLQWGRLANKMGSFVEDMVLPAFPRILRRYFGIEEVDDLLVRRRKRHPADRSRHQEFDLIAWTADTVFWNETKSTPTVKSYADFLADERSVYEFFPELEGKRIVKIASALSIPREVVDFLSKRGCYAMMLGEEHMELVNYKTLSGRRPLP